ncbi:hypothetical protein THAOC_26677, partial [Thalassiosira oceanica]
EAVLEDGDAELPEPFADEANEVAIPLEFMSNAAQTERAVDEEGEYLEANAASADINNDVVDLEFKDRLERSQFMPRKLQNRAKALGPTI